MVAPTESYISPLDNVLDRLDGVEEHNGYWQARCPTHSDRNPSLSVSLGEDGRVLLNCHAGCETADIVDTLGLHMRDLFERSKGRTRGERGLSIPSRTTATLQPYPCTLANYARAKGLPIEHLQELGLTDFHYVGEPAIRIPYRNPDGSEAAMRFRTALEKADGRDDRFRWRKGSKAMLYGLERSEGIRKAGYVVLVEGESDCHTLWYHGIPALGVPGANNWKAEWSGHLDGLARIYVVKEPDQGGDTLLEKLARSEAIVGRLYVVELADA